MPDKVLYFPYIRVPNSAWFTRILLYWDEVGTLVPYEFIATPERLGGHTRSLVETGLLKQVIPGMYVHRIPKFNDAFLNYLDTLGSEIGRRQRSFEKGSIFSIYTEKILGLGDELGRLKLARPSRRYRNLFDVERQTGLEFMTYLAVGLGRLKDLHFTPVTDKRIVLEKAAPASSFSERLNGIRLEVLEEALPAPCCGNVNLSP